MWWWPAWTAVAVLLAERVVSAPDSLLLVSFDGFRHDLLNETLVPNIHKWAQTGSWFTRGVESQYLSHTAPNHMSIVTGRGERMHGIVGNTFINTTTHRRFDVFNTTGQQLVNQSLTDSSWYLASPIWIHAEHNGRKAGCMAWPMCDAVFADAPHQPSFVQTWGGLGNLTKWERQVDNIINLLARSYNPMNFVAYYVEEPDMVLHQNGFHNGELQRRLGELDQLWAYLLKRVHSSGLEGRLNIILTADHGHAQIESVDTIFFVGDHINVTDGVELGDRTMYVADEQRRNELVKTLRDAVTTSGLKTKIYTKDEMAQKWDWAASPRVGDIIIEPAIGEQVLWGHKEDFVASLHGHPFNQSTHGHDPRAEEMRALLVAVGPSFRHGYRTDMVPLNTDLMPLMCHLLDVPIPRDLHGSMEIFKEALKADGAGSGLSGAWILWIVLALSLITIGVAILCVLCRRRAVASSYSSPTAAIPSSLNDSQNRFVESP